ncbi:MAG: serine/threonine-protein kinase [Planctomycetia bacterium]|nr:serine/threonine-protein kinase [Planctomycetia bacterium]
MGLLDSFKKALSGGKVDVQKRFEFLREAISGTMSSFNMVRDRQTGEIVGLKILDKEKTAAFEERLRGLKRPPEGEIATAIAHPRIVKTLEYGITTRGEQFLVMEFIGGPGLNSLLIARSPLMEGKRLTLTRQAAEAVAAVHKAGYIHRDICPRNLMATTAEVTELKLIDFGLTLPATKEFMQPGNRTGTPNYMAPEIVKRQGTDQRVDIFSFGVTAYEMFTYDLPWERGVTGQAAMQHANFEPKDIARARPTIHPTLGKAIMKCIARNPVDRFASMDDFLKSIKGVEQDDAS